MGNENKIELKGEKKIILSNRKNKTCFCKNQGEKNIIAMISLLCTLQKVLSSECPFVLVIPFYRKGNRRYFCRVQQNFLFYQMAL